VPKTLLVCLLLNGTSALFRPLVPRIVEVEQTSHVEKVFECYPGEIIAQLPLLTFYCKYGKLAITIGSIYAALGLFVCLLLNGRHISTI